MHQSKMKNRSSITSSPVVAQTVRVIAGVAVVAGVMGSAVWAKQAGSLPALAEVETPVVETSESAVEIIPASFTPDATEPELEVIAIEGITEDSPEWTTDTRWFDGRPVRPAKVMVMRVTGYSPDHRSCGIFADGQTATLHSVWTNGMALVAADPKVLPYGSMLTIPGYANEEIVPVLDCGGAIKGARLDLLFATHRTALRWGVQELRVTIWEYADGEPMTNPRKVR